FSIEKLIFGVIAVFLITAAGNALNDYYDEKTDKINKPNRPIPLKLITKKQALVFSKILFICGLILSWFVNIWAFGLALINICILWIYPKIKQKTIFSSIIAAYLCGSVFLYAFTIIMVAEKLKLCVLLFLLSFLLMLSREITKDIADIRGDKNNKITIPIKYGIKFAGLISAIIMALAVILSLYLIDFFGKIYILAIFFADTILIYCLIRLIFNAKKYADECSGLQKISAVIVIVAIIFCGIFF
ncbi:MAG: digeranylgeranylglyceryl phosphate synthase, partial [Candidatus Aenigmarchaeota archaeon ex4484_52]